MWTRMESHAFFNFSMSCRRMETTPVLLCGACAACPFWRGSKQQQWVPDIPHHSVWRLNILMCSQTCFHNIIHRQLSCFTARTEGTASTVTRIPQSDNRDCCQYVPISARPVPTHASQPACFPCMRGNTCSERTLVLPRGAFCATALSKLLF